MNTFTQKGTPSKSEQALHWAIKHWQQLALGLVSAVIVGLIGLSIVSNLKQLRLRSWAELTQAQMLYDQSRLDEAEKIAREIISRHRSGAVAAQSHILLGDVLAKRENYGDAVSEYSQAVGKASSKDLRALALTALAYGQEQLKDYSAAQTTHQRFLTDSPDHFLAGRVRLSLARVQLELQLFSEARLSLEKVVSLHPSTLWAKEAQKMLEELPPIEEMNK